MNIESKVLDLIAPVLDTGRADFYAGTLFLEDVTEQVGRNVFHILSKEFGLGKVSVNIYKQINGFVYDFVA